MNLTDIDELSKNIPELEILKIPKNDFIKIWDDAVE